MIRIFIILLMSFSHVQAQEWYCSTDNDVRYIDTALGKQKIMIFNPEGETKELIFFLHGDSAFGPPSYQYDMARRIVKYRKGAMVVAILRPGYEDGCGDRSEGEVGYKMGDNYTAEVVDALSEVISAVQLEYKLKTILFGHSGGAALSALLMNRHPDLSDTALLAACPCDLPKWRQHMYERTGNERWLSDLPGLSPMDEMDNMNLAARVVMIGASFDRITPVQLILNYSNKLDKNKITNQKYIRSMSRNPGAKIHQFGHDLITFDDHLKYALEKLTFDRQ